jgi:predicted O-methyltransferase YrrM
MSTETEVSEAIAGLVRLTQPDVIVELGSAWGHTTRMLGMAAKLNGHGRVTAIDIDQAAARHAAHWCRPLPVDVAVADVYKWIPPDGIDFLFVDAGDPPDRPKMFTYMRPYLARNAVVVSTTRRPTTECFRVWRICRRKD